jgi:hypothetical protein
MKPELKRLSGNTISELYCLINEIKALINKDYKHVSNHLPNTIQKSLNDLSKKIDIELDNRYDDLG